MNVINCKYYIICTILFKCYYVHMQVTNTHIQNGLLIISGKEHGRLFIIKNGVVKEFDHVEEHPPRFSDNEGFFIRAGNGERYGSGNPRETDDKRNLDRYKNALEKELDVVIKEVEPAALFITEPEHLKGMLEETVQKFTDLKVNVVAYGNYVKSTDEELQKLLEGFQNTSADPADPASVAGEENAEEKENIRDRQIRDNL